MQFLDKPGICLWWPTTALGYLECLAVVFCIESEFCLSYSLTVRTFRPDFRGGLFRPYFTGGLVWLDFGGD